MRLQSKKRADDGDDYFTGRLPACLPAYPSILDIRYRSFEATRPAYPAQGRNIQEQYLPIHST